MIEVTNLSLQFADTPVLDEINLSIRQDEFVLLVGPNGAGKTTLLDQLSGLGEPSEGTVTIDGVDVYRQPATGRAKIGRVFESPTDQLIGATVRDDVAFGPENLGLPPQQIERQVRESLAAVGFQANGERAIDSLSGGEAARVAIAGALAMSPSYLVLDEPTAGLDYPGRQRVLAQLQQTHAEGIGIILATHDLRDFKSLADRVVGLEDGNIVFDNSPEIVSDRLEAIGVRKPTDW